LSSVLLVSCYFSNLQFNHYVQHNTLMTRYGKAPATATPVESSSSRDFSSITVDTAQQSTDEQSGEITFAGEVVRQIEALVESFHTGKTKKSQTIFKIGQVLENKPGENEQLKSDSLNGYLATLDGIEALAAQSDRHGTHVSGSALGKRKSTLVREVGDLKSLTGVIPPSPRLALTTSYRGYHRNKTWTRQEAPTTKNQEMMIDQPLTMSLEGKVVRTRSNEFMNRKCLGSETNKDLESQVLTEAVTKPGVSSTSFTVGPMGPVFHTLV
jgi:hypothetical protein